MPEIRSYHSREAAGEILAEKIAELKLASPHVLAIPRGGIQVAEAVCDRLKVPINVLVVKKLPAPGNPEYGFGAVTEDGTRVLNERAVKSLFLTEDIIDAVAEKVSKEIRHRKEVFGGLDDEKIHNSNVILVDDGIATGYSLIAGIETLKKRVPKSLVVAVPVSSYDAYYKVREMVDDIICPIVSDEMFFAVASYYKEWYDLSEGEIIVILDRYRERYSH